MSVPTPPKSNPYAGPPALAASGYPGQPAWLVSSGARHDQIGALCFWTLAIIAIASLNSFVLQFAQIPRALSWVMFALCIVVLLAYRMAFWRYLGRSGRLFFIFMASYLAIGSLFSLHLRADESLRWYEEFRNVFASVLILAACATGAYHACLYHSEKSSLRYVFVVSLLPVFSVYLAMLFPTWFIVPIENRATGFFLNPNEQGIACVAAAAIGFGCLQSEKWNLWVLVGIALAIVATVLTYSRAAMLALLVVATVQLAISPVFRRKSFLLGIVLVMGMFIWLAREATRPTTFSRLDDEQVERIETLFALLQGDFSERILGDRLATINKGMQKWRERPLLGHGLGNAMVWSDYHRRYFVIHNSFVRVLAESGVVPFLLLAFSVLLTIYDAHRCKSSPIRTAVLGLVLGYCLYSMTDGSQLTRRNFMAFWGIAYGLMAAIREINRRRTLIRAAPRAAT